MNRLFDAQTTTKSGVSPAPSTEGVALRANISHWSVKYSGEGPAQKQVLLVRRNSSIIEAAIWKRGQLRIGD
jgi:hypothetical protein